MVLSNTGQENQFYDIPERKNAFLDYKKFKNSKTLGFFSKQVTHGFSHKLAIFPSFCF